MYLVSFNVDLFLSVASTVFIFGLVLGGILSHEFKKGLIKAAFKVSIIFPIAALGLYLFG